MDEKSFNCVVPDSIINTEIKDYWDRFLNDNEKSCADKSLLKLVRKQFEIPKEKDIYHIVWGRFDLKKIVLFAYTQEYVYIMNDPKLFKSKYTKIRVSDIPGYVFVIKDNGSCVALNKEADFELRVYGVSGQFYIDEKKRMALYVKKALDDIKDFWYKNSFQSMNARKELFSCIYDRSIEYIKKQGALSENLRVALNEFIEERAFKEKAAYIFLRVAILNYRFDEIYRISRKLSGTDGFALEMIKHEMVKEINNINAGCDGKDPIYISEPEGVGEAIAIIDKKNEKCEDGTFFSDLADALFRRYTDQACKSNNIVLNDDFEEYVKQCQRYVKNDEDRKNCYTKWIDIFKCRKNINEYFYTRDELGFSSLHYELFEQTIAFPQLLDRNFSKIIDFAEKYENLDDPLKILFDFGYILFCRNNINAAKDIIQLKNGYEELNRLIVKAEKKIKIVEGAIVTYNAVNKIVETSREYNRIRNQMVADDVQRRIDEERERIMDGKSMNYHGWVRAQERLDRFKKANGLYDLEEIGQNDYYDDDDEPSLDVLDRLLLIKQTLIDSLLEIREQQVQYVDGWLKIYAETRRDYANSDNRVISEIYRLSSDSEYYKAYITRLSRPKVLVFQFGHFWYVDKEIYDQYFYSDESDSVHSNRQARDNQSAKFSFESNGFVNKDKIKKPYGNCWFSPKARKDIRRLKKEYRRLAVMFHPDNFDGDPGIFVEIQMERMDILSKMKV